MDLGAYVNIEMMDGLAKENGISVPRLRGYRLMSVEEPVTAEEINKMIKDIELEACESWATSRFGTIPGCYVYSARTYAIRHKYMRYEGGEPVEILWDKIHGKKRKRLKYMIKTRTRRVLQQYAAFNKYAGKEDVLYIHARIGGDNWDYFNGSEIARQPWFLERVDDCYDNTYCDIYARLTKKGD